MRIENEIVRLGGLQPIGGEFNPLTQNDLSKIQQEIMGELPIDYVWIMRTYGECIFINSVSFALDNQQPEYRHPEQLGLPNGAGFCGSEVSTIYGRRATQNEFTLLRKLQIFRDRMPTGFLPFADDGLGNQLCICVSPAHYQKIYWWDHELEWDKEDYLEETGNPMPAEAKYQNVYLVADNLTDFFEKLIIAE